jgi:hypothetical protein
MKYSGIKYKGEPEKGFSGMTISSLAVALKRVDG